MDYDGGGGGDGESGDAIVGRLAIEREAAKPARGGGGGEEAVAG